MDYREFRARQHSFQSDAGEIAYVDEGEGEPILLLHGYPTSSWLFRNVVPVLVGAGYRAIAPDMLGYGSSAKPADPARYGYKDHMRRTLALMQSLGLETWTQVCHDLGGPVTWEMIDTEPQHLRRLVITNTTAYVDGWNPPRAVGLMSTPIGSLMLAMLKSKSWGLRLGKAMFDPYVGHPEKLTPADREGYWLPFHEGATRTLRYFASEYPKMKNHFPRYQAAFRQVDIPAMLIWGKSDSALDCDTMTRQFARDFNVADEDIHVFDDAKHFLWDDYPEEMAHLIAEFAA